MRASIPALSIPLLAVLSCAPGTTSGSSSSSGSSSTQDGGGGVDCRGEIPTGRTVSETCCPAHGRDACGALLFCDALDGRTEYTCYPERSRADLTSCAEDYACSSGECSADTQLCRSFLGSVCTMETGCARAASGHATLCDAAVQPSVCALLGDGTVGARCALPAHCQSGQCVNARCGAVLGGMCTNTSQCSGGATCGQCDTCGGIDRRCVTTCSALECTDADPSMWNCYERTGISAPCPTVTPTMVACDWTAYRADHLAFEVRVTWSAPSMDGWEVGCDDGAQSRFYSRVAGDVHSKTLTVDTPGPGTVHTCSVRALQRTTDTTYGWLLGPSASCMVTAP